MSLSYYIRSAKGYSKSLISYGGFEPEALQSQVACPIHYTRVLKHLVAKYFFMNNFKKAYVGTKSYPLELLKKNSNEKNDLAFNNVCLCGVKNEVDPKLSCVREKKLVAPCFVHLSQGKTKYYIIVS